MLRIEVRPPAQARPGVPLYPPIAAKLRSENNIYDQLSNMWAVATLVRYSGGEVLYDQLGGKVTDSAHPLPEGHSSSSSSRDRAYFYFPDLAIYHPGKYRIRISLMEMDYSNASNPEGIVRVREYADTHSITIEDRSHHHSRPSKRPT